MSRSVEEDSSIAAGVAKVVLTGGQVIVFAEQQWPEVVWFVFTIFSIRFAGGAGGRAPRIGESG